MEIIAIIPPILLVLELSSSAGSRPRCSPHRALMTCLAMCAACTLPDGRDWRRRSSEEEKRTGEEEKERGGERTYSTAAGGGGSAVGHAMPRRRVLVVPMSLRCRRTPCPRCDQELSVQKATHLFWEVRRRRRLVHHRLLALTVGRLLVRV